MPFILFFLVGFLTSCSSNPVKETAISSTKSIAMTTYQIDSVFKEESPTTIQMRERGIVHFLKLDYPKAIAQLETAFLLYPESEETKSKFNLYYAYLATGEYNKALSAALFLVKEHPYLSLSYQQVGLAHYFLGQTKEAGEAFDRALEFDAHSPRLHFYSGLVEERLNQFERKEKSFLLAEKEYKQILNSNKNELSAYYELASLYLFWNVNINEVPALIDRAKSILSSDNVDLTEGLKSAFSEFYFPLIEGIYSYRQSNPKDAIEFLLTAFSNAPSGLKPDLSEIYFYLGQSHKQQGEKVKALTFLEQSLALDPKGPLSKQAENSIRELPRN